MFKSTIILLLLFLSINAKSASEPFISYDESIKLVHSIQDLGIEYGDGDKNVYVFVDPLCKYSRKFISTITNKPKMLSKYKYTIYLYEIPRLHSSKTIASIYNSKKPINTLLDVMLKDKNISAIPTKKVLNTVDAIDKVAHKLHINKRPSIIVEK